MTSKILIDGWNVCWKMAEIVSFIPEQLDIAQSRLNIKVQNYFANRKVIYKIFYDGQPGIINDTPVNKKQDIRFSKNPEKADHLIIKFLKKQKNTRQWTVITSDRELAGRAKSHGAIIIDSEFFANKITSADPPGSAYPQKENPNVSATEIDYWLNKFNTNGK